MASKALPHFHRQRFLLHFIKLAGGKISKMDVQKLLFLLHQETDIQYFDFVPYYCGCYSFQLSSDLEGLAKAGWLKVTEKSIELSDTFATSMCAKTNEIQSAKQFLQKHKTLRGDSLQKHVYELYPYFASKSKMANHILGTAKYIAEKINEEETLYTIGYEGISFEKYLNSLIKNQIKALCDIRENPLSRKFGFSKSALSSILPKFGIAYHHIPELGITSSKRKHLETENDYKLLFTGYQKLLPKKSQYIREINDLLGQERRVALTCFEHNPGYCHRSYLSKYMQDNFPISVKHL
jgi:uncharacterized protein YwgA